MSRAARIVAAQAAVVAVLVAVVYLTLLRPDDPVGPAGIDVPGAPETTLRVPFGDHADEQPGRKGEAERARRQPIRPGTGVLVVGSRSAGPLRPAVAGPSAGLFPGGTPSSFDPNHDQYDDAVELVLRKVYGSPAD